jgi:hypothetical protein
VKTAVAFIIFNRPEFTARVFERIREAQPTQLFVVADGPRPNHPEDARNCQAARAVIEQGVDWSCEVLRDYADRNLGCRKRVSSGLDWVFQQTEEAIILEDDCLPHPSFFSFCEEILDYYRNDTRVMMISGTTFTDAHPKNYSYIFSRINTIWGWATWRRAWKYYDVDMRLWPDIRQSRALEAVLSRSEVLTHWTQLFDAAFLGHVDTWDYQWVFASLVQNGLNVIPKANLISNIGFTTDATHTIDPSNPFAELPVRAIDLPLRHPPFTLPDQKADYEMFRRIFAPTFRRRLKLRILSQLWTLRLMFRRKYSGNSTSKNSN